MINGRELTGLSYAFILFQQSRYANTQFFFNKSFLFDVASNVILSVLLIVA
jgi:hypothetical protein